MEKTKKKLHRCFFCYFALRSGPLPALGKHPAHSPTDAKVRFQPIIFASPVLDFPIKCLRKRPKAGWPGPTSLPRTLLPPNGSLPRDTAPGSRLPKIFSLALAPPRTPHIRVGTGAPFVQLSTGEGISVQIRLTAAAPRKRASLRLLRHIRTLEKNSIDWSTLTFVPCLAFCLHPKLAVRISVSGAALLGLRSRE